MEILISILLIVFIVGVCLHATGFFNKSKDSLHLDEGHTSELLNEPAVNENSPESEKTPSLTEEELTEETTQRTEENKSENSWESLPEAINKRAQELLEEDGDWE